MAWDQDPGGFHHRTATRSGHVWPFDTRNKVELPYHDTFPDGMPVVWRWSVFTRKRNDDWRTVENLAYGETPMIADAIKAADQVIEA